MKPKIKVTDSVVFITDAPSLYFFDYKDASLSNLSRKDKLTKLSDRYVKEKLIIWTRTMGSPVKNIYIANGKTYYELWIECRIDEDKYVVHPQHQHSSSLRRMVYVEAKDIKFGWHN